MERRLVTVTAGVIEYQGKILVAERRKDKSLGGFWEFPGGKIEAGETCEQTLKREIKEEFDIEIEVGPYLMEHTFAYPDFDLKMYVYQASWNGEGKIKICDHETYAFVTLEQMEQYPFAGADIPVIAFLKQR